MTEPLDIVFLITVLSLGAVFFLLQGLTRNLWIKRRLRASLFLFAVALALDLFRVYGGLQSIFRTVETLVVTLAVLLAVVVLVFNKFRHGSVSEKYPSIVQDAVVIGAFLLVAAYAAPEKLLTTSAVGALVIGLALQDTLGNLFAGLALQIEKPFFVGDWVRVASLEGRVVGVTWRATKIQTKAGHHCVIPNTIISKDAIVNYTQPSPILRLQKKIGFGYEVPPNKVKQVVLQTLSDIPEILSDPPPEVLLDSYSDFSIDYYCRFWIRDFGRSEPVSDRFTTLLYYRLGRENIQIPFPIRDIRMSDQADLTERQELGSDRRNFFVEGVDLFAALQGEEKTRIAERLERITFAKDEVIVREGQSGESMFFIERGQARVLTEKDGVQNAVALLQDGQYFGEMSLLTGEPRSATVQAVNDVQAYRLRKEGFRQVLLNHPQIAETLSQVIADRRQLLEQKKAEILSPKAKETLRKSIFKKMQTFFGL